MALYTDPRDRDDGMFWTLVASILVVLFLIGFIYTYSSRSDVTINAPSTTELQKPAPSTSPAPAPAPKTTP
jgi:hypothetical protein